MILRTLESALKDVARQYPVVTLAGPRQSGKTTLVREAFPRHAYASLEEPDSRISSIGAAKRISVSGGLDRTPSTAGTAASGAPA